MSTEEKQQEARFVFHASGSLYSLLVIGVAEYLRRKPTLRFLVGFLGTAGIVTWLVHMTKLTPLQLQNAPSLLIVGAAFVLLATISSPLFEIVIPEKQATLEREKAEEKFQASPEPQNALNLDMSRLNEYYKINQSQARSSFRWSVFAMLTGMVTIVAGIWLFYFRPPEKDVFMSSLAAAAGIVTNLVSGLFLYLHNKTQERSLVYFEKLLKVQRVALAVRLAEIHEPDKGKIVGQAVTHLLTADRNPDRVAD